MLACLTLLFLGVGLGHLFHLYTEKNRDPEKCTAPVIVFYNNTQANLTLDFMYSLKNALVWFPSAEHITSIIK